MGAQRTLKLPCLAKYTVSYCVPEAVRRRAPYCSLMTTRDIGAQQPVGNDAFATVRARDHVRSPAMSDIRHNDDGRRTDNRALVLDDEQPLSRIRRDRSERPPVSLAQRRLRSVELPEQPQQRRQIAVARVTDRCSVHAGVSQKAAGPAE